MAHIPNEDLKPGDIVRFLNTVHMIAAIEPYEGNLADIMFGIARADDGWGISLERGGQIEVERI